MARDTDAHGDDLELLIKDFEHWERAYASNEELGEKRLSFFMGVITTTFGGLAFLAKDEPTAAEDANLYMAAAFAALVLFLFGLLTLLRIKRRNLLTNQHLRLLDTLRLRLAPRWAEHVTQEFPPRRADEPRELVNGGLLFVSGLLNSALAAILIWTLLKAGDVHSPGESLAAAALAAVVTAALQYWRMHRPRKPAAPPDTFRAGVGLIVANAEGHVLALERAHNPGTWQLPQGGIEPGESVEHACARELQEETSLTPADVRYVDELPVLLAYELPAELRNPKSGRGQAHHWRLYHLRLGAEHKLRPGKEARALGWKPLEQLARDAIEFRRPGYALLLRELGPKLRA